MLRTTTGGAGNGTAGAADQLVSIGTVLNQLREEFPEVTISKIRFLEAEGLVEPQR
ncbi:MerR family transcriptional regulator, partial [Streptomyces sp. NPDC000229]